MTQHRPVTRPRQQRHRPKPQNLRIPPHRRPHIRNGERRKHRNRVDLQVLDHQAIAPLKPPPYRRASTARP